MEKKLISHLENLETILKGIEGTTYVYNNGSIKSSGQASDQLSIAAKEVQEYIDRFPEIKKYMPLGHKDHIHYDHVEGDLVTILGNIRAEIG